MNRTITWLHLSDLHAREQNDWNSRQVTDAMTRDLKLMQKEHGLRPDLIFFTGDIAFGAAGGEKMTDQYKLVRNFLDAVRRAFDPELSIRDIYVVPGNHDVDRGEVTPDQTAWLRHPDRKLSEIINAMRDGKKQWRAWVDRLTNYRNFLSSYGLAHLSFDDPHLIWGDSREYFGFRVGLAGLNSAWSCSDDDKGKIWFGTEWQIAQLKQRMGPVDFSFALLHHPGNWFTEHEDPMAMRRLRQEFNVIVHGHEHAEWVEANADGSIVLSAGACYQASWMANGYSWGQLDIDKRSMTVWLRQWDAAGNGWVSREIAGKAKNGIWSITNLQWLLKGDVIAADSSDAPLDADIAQHKAIETAEQHFTRRYCQHVINQCDTLELFGCDIPIELQRHQLSIAYVSLNLSRDDEDSENGVESNALEVEGSSPKTPDTAENDEFDLSSATVETIMDQISQDAGRLLIHGPAGAGKSTLLRWCAIQAANNVLEGPSILRNAAGIARNPKLLAEWREFKDANAPGVPNSWRWKVPVLIRLRDCASGKLPAANDLPRFVAKHLPSAPAEWMTGIFDAGRALVLLDGVDEIHRDKRRQLASEIRDLIKTYPHCTYVVTTRPGAVERGWLKDLDFTEARVEPMSKSDREEFIDKWYRSAALSINRPRPGEDLAQTAERLKTTLVEQPELSALATNPLLCAMICALYRERQEHLPETPPDLCEALCHMLLHRRERETIGLEEAHFVITWRALQYTQKKGLIAHLAWHMVNNGESSIEYAVATALVGDILETTPGRIRDEAGEVLQALLERSGLLRPAGNDRLDFIHNTLKEYLAAIAVVEAGEWKTLANRGEDPAWQPVTLFALSLSPETFSSALVRHFLAQIPLTQTTKRIGSLTKAEKVTLGAAKARQFFLVRCRSAAKRLAPDLSSAIDKIARQLLPPASMGDAEALAQIGPRVLLYSDNNLGDPNWWRRQTGPMATRCLRLLRRINGSRARTVLQSIRELPSILSQLTGEWLLAWSEICPDAPLYWPFENREIVYLSATRVKNLELIVEELPTLWKLFADRSHISDISPLAKLKAVRELDLSWTGIENLSPLTELTSLGYLDLSGTRITNVEALRKLTSLCNLRLLNTQLQDYKPISALVNLEHLTLECTSADNIAFLSPLKSLAYLHLISRRSLDLNPLAALPFLTNLYIRAPHLVSISALKYNTRLKFLYISGSDMPSIEPLMGLVKLETLYATGTRIGSLDGVNDMLSLRILDVSETTIGSLKPLSGLKSLETLNVRRTRVNDLTPLLSCQSLMSLDIAGSPISDLKPLLAMPSLKFLSLDPAQNIEAEALQFETLRPDVFLRTSQMTPRVLSPDGPTTEEQ